jgi:hypothetical protein
MHLAGRKIIPIGPKSNILISSDFDNENQAIAKAWTRGLIDSSSAGFAPHDLDSRYCPKLNQRQRERAK